jgi:hypothetical protein
MKILIMGLPGSGKTTFAKKLKELLEAKGHMSYERALMLPINTNPIVTWFNADDVRKRFNDWDFSKEGRIRQSIRMADFAISAGGDYVICDFVAPLPEMRNNFKADWTIWMDTINEGRFEDTNQIFVKPDVYDFRIPNWDNLWGEFVVNHIVNNCRRATFSWKQETVQMLGRWQPWHKGHRALFERAIKKTGQVVIQIRDCQGWNDSNPFSLEQVKENIKRDLDPLYQGQYYIQIVPNIVNITYGRDVGYKIEQEIFDESITSVSATKIRKELGLK